jgi:hypothetical protein
MERDRRREVDGATWMEKEKKWMMERWIEKVGWREIDGARPTGEMDGEKSMERDQSRELESIERGDSWMERIEWREIDIENWMKRDRLDGERWIERDR